MPIMEQVYLVIAVVGFGYVCFSFFMGHLESGHGEADMGGHLDSGAGHAGGLHLGASHGHADAHGDVDVSAAGHHGGDYAAGSSGTSSHTGHGSSA